MLYQIHLVNNIFQNQFEVTNQYHEISYFICGCLNTLSQMIILKTKNNEEIGRLYHDKKCPNSKYYIKIKDNAPINITTVNLGYKEVLFAAHLCYWAYGNVKNQQFYCYKGIKKIATIFIAIKSNDITISCDIKDNIDPTYILLTAILITKLHVSTLHLPNLKILTNPQLQA